MQSRSEWQRLSLATNGITLHAVASGPEDGPLVILLHGFPEYSLAWRRQIGPLAAAGIRVVALDQRGYNLSEKPAGIAAYGIDQLAGDVLGIATTLGRERFAVVGHDWGAAVAWHLAARHAERIERAVMINAPHPAVLREYMRSHPSQIAKSYYMGFFQLPMLPEAMLRAGEFALLARSLRRTSRSETFSHAELGRYRAAWAQPGALTGMVNWYRALRRYAFGMQKPQRISVPVRVIWGDRDAFLNAGLADASAALCERVEVFHLPDATHWVPHEEAHEVNRLLIEFCANHEQRTAAQ